MPGKALLIAFHFPPIRHSSGIQRTLKFCTYLREFGWQSSVLTVQPRVYENVGNDQLREIPENVPVVRAFALDSQRDLAIAGRYWEATAWPDRYATWWFGGVWSGLKLIRRFRPDVIWSTTPVPTAHMIARTLHRLSGLPWIADFRDPITEDEYPPDPVKRERLRRFEGSVLGLCAKAVVTTPGTVQLHQRRFADVPRDRWTIIPNGYDEENFAAAEQLHGARDGASATTLVHSGILYPAERDPRAFFAAVAELKRAGAFRRHPVRIVLRATCNDELYAPLLREHDIADVVALEPAVSYREALREMLDASGLLIFQGSSCNHQIPAKLYEYMRSGRPILGFTDPAGDTAATLRSNGVTDIARLDSAEEIKATLERFLATLEAGSARGVPLSAAERYSRKSGARDLAAVFEEAVAARGRDRR